MSMDCCLPGSQPTVVIIRLKRLSSSFTMTLSDRSTEGKLYLLSYWILVQLLILLTMIAWRPSFCCWRHVVLVPVISIRSDADFCLETIAAALLQFAVMYRRARYLARSSLSPTPTMLWNFSIGTVHFICPATSAERRCAGHTWSVTVWPCPSGTEGAALAASHSSYSVQGRAFDVYGTWQSLSRVSKWIRSPSQQQPSTSTSSLCQQPRLHCYMDKNYIWRPSLLCCRFTVWNSLSESVRSAKTLSSFKRKLKTYLFNISF